MASTVPVESQAIHKFDLPHLKWNADGESSGEQERRRSAKSSSRRVDESSGSPFRQSPLRDSPLPTPPRVKSPAAVGDELSVHVDCLIREESPIGGESSKLSSPVRECMKQSMIGCESVTRSFVVGESVRLFPMDNLKDEQEDFRRNHSTDCAMDSNKSRANASTTEQLNEKLEKKSNAADADASEIKRPKILIKIPCKNNREEENPQDESLKINHNNEHGENEIAQSGGKTNTNSIPEETKTWNLRPRRKPNGRNGATIGAKTANDPEKSEMSKAVGLTNANMSGQRDGKCDGSGEKKEKRKLSISISLSKEQIEEDIFAMTGSKPARRPRKRAKNIKKLLDSVFPGLWLASISPDSY